MAKQPKQDSHDAVENLNEHLTSIEQRVQNNQKGIMWACIIAAAVVCIILFYVYGIRKPGIEAANNAIGQADITMVMGNDSLALKQYQQVADEYGHDAGNRATLSAAILLYQQGKYEEALKYLKDYKASEEIIGAAAQSLEGDCYVNLKKYEEALGCFQKAAKTSDNNPYYTPFFMMKEATVQRKLKNYAAEAEIYRTIMDKYPQYSAAQQIDFEKYLKRAEIQAGQK